VALSVDTVWEVQTGGDDSNGGGFVTGAAGTDRSMGTSAHATLTTASLVHSTTTQVNVDAGDYTVLNPEDVGNIIQVSVNGGALAFYQITVADTANNRWTVDRSLGTAGQTVAGKMGGCFASPGALNASVGQGNIGGHIAWIKAGTYTMTTTTPGKAGPIAMINIASVVNGYSATRGDFAGRPVISAGAQTTFAMMAQTGNNVGLVWRHIEFDGDSNTAVSGPNISGSSNLFIDCVFSNFTDTSMFGLSMTSAGTAFACKASNCYNGFVVTSSRAHKCWADACSNTGFIIGNSGTAETCLASDCTGDGFAGTGNVIRLRNCTSDGNGGDGFDFTGGGVSLFNCIATNNTGMGFNGAVNITSLFRCASKTNTGGRTDISSKYDFSPILLTVDPYTDAASDDYSLNNTAGGGADLRAAGFPVFGQTDYADIGALQHADPAASGGARPHGLQPIPYGV
jgi:hypothetical protein